MRHYALKFLSEAGRITGRCAFQAASDTEAVGAASAIIGEARGELRTGPRLVMTWGTPVSTTADVGAA